MSDFGGGDDVQVQVGLETDAADFARLTNLISDAIGKGVKEGTGELTRLLRAEFNRLQQTISRLDVAADLRKAESVAKDTAAAVGKIATEAKRINFDQADADVRSLESDLAALFKRTDALRKTTDVTLVPPDTFALIDRLQRKFLDLQRTVANNQDKLSTDKGFASAINKQFASIQASAVREGQVVQSTLRDLNNIRNREAQQAIAIEAAKNRQITAETVAAGKQQAVALQAQSQLEITQARSAGKVRVAIVQGTVNSILRLERGLGTAIAGVARTSVSGIGRIYSDTLGQIPRIFRRSNDAVEREIRTSNSTVEREYRSSLSKRERLITESVNRQTRQVVALEGISRRASTGVTGALTGRGLGGGVLALGGGIAIGAIFKNAFDEAVNFNEQLNKVQQILGQDAKVLTDFAQTATRSFGITSAKALEAGGNFANILKGAGIATKDAAFLSAALTGLGADLASFNNTSVDDALLALRSGLAGEFEPLRRFGVLLDDAQLRQKALSLGIYNGKGILNAYQKEVAATALIFEKTRDAQGDFQRTNKGVANQLRITSQVFSQFLAVLIRPTLPAVSKGLQAVNGALTELTKIALGQAGPAMKVVRDAAIGAAAGLAALLVAKTAAEAVSLLAKSLSLLATPLGITALAFAGAGAAIVVLSKRSAEFRQVVSNVTSGLGDLAGRAGDLISRGVGNLVKFLDQTAIPAFNRFAAVAIDKGTQAFRAIERFTRDTALPALQRGFAVVRDAAGTAFDAIRRAAAAAAPVVLPILRGIGSVLSDIGGAFRRLVQGDFAGFFRGLGAAATNAVQQLTPVAKTVGETVANAYRSVVASIRTFLSNIDFSAVATSILKAIELVGRVIGNIATDPRVLKAAAAIGIAALAIGFSFVKGVIEGIASNVPELASEVKSLFIALGKIAIAGLGDGIRAALSNPALLGGIIAAFAFRKQLVALFRSSGEEAGGALTSGVDKALARNKKGGGTDFLRGLFGGEAGAFDLQIKNLERFRKAVDREVGGINRVLTTAGRDTVKLIPGEELTTFLGRAQDEYKKLGKDVGDAGLRGLELRTRLTTGLSDLASPLERVRKGVGQIGGAFADIGRQVNSALDRQGAQIRNFFAPGSFEVPAKAAGGGIVRGFTDGIKNVGGGIAGAFGAIKTSISNSLDDLQRVGTSKGQAIGQAVLGGVASVFGGQALGRGDALGGLAGILGGSLAAGAVNPILGVATAGIGLFSAAMTASSEAAKKAKREIGEYASAVEGAGTAAERSAGIVKALNDNLKDESAGTTKFLASTSLDLGKLAEAINAGTAATDQFLGSFVDGLISQFPALKKGLDDAGISLQQFVELIRQGRGGNVIAEFSISAQNSFVELQKQLKDAGISVDDFISGIDFVSSETKEAFKGVELDRYREKIRGTIDQAKKLPDAFQAPTIQTVVDDLNRNLDTTKQKADDATNSVKKLLNPEAGSLQQTIDEALSGAQGQGQSILDAALSGFGGASADSVAAKVRLAVGDVKGTLAEIIGQGIKDGLIVQPSDADRFTQSYRTAVLGAIQDPNLRAQVATALDASLATAKLEIPTAVKAQADVGSVEETKRQVQAQIDQNPAKATVDVQPIDGLDARARALGKSAGSAAADASKAVFGNRYAKETADRVTSAIPAAAAAGAQVGQAAGGGVAKGVTQQAPAARSAVAAAVSGATSGIAQVGAFAKGVSVGHALADGLIAGIQDKINQVANKARDMVTSAIAAARAAAGVASPSKVFRGIGVFIAQGLALGIGEGQDVASAAADVIDKAVKATLSKVDQQAALLKSARAKLFEAIFGSANPEITVRVNADDARAAITTTFAGIASAVDSAKSQLAELSKKKPGELTLADKQLLGEKATSLSLKDITGVANRNAIKDAVESIKSYSEALLEQGTPLAKVVEQTKAWREQLIREALQYGFNKNELLALLDSLGLSADAIAAFAKEAADAGVAVKKATESLTAVEGTAAATGGPGNLSAVAATLSPVQTFINHIYLPTGDPEAAALAVVNRQARAAL